MGKIRPKAGKTQPKSRQNTAKKQAKYSQKAAKKQVISRRNTAKKAGKKQAKNRQKAGKKQAKSRQKAGKKQAKSRQKAGKITGRKAKSVITEWQKFLEFQAFKNQKNPRQMTIEMFLEKRQNYVTNPKKKKDVLVIVSTQLLKSTVEHFTRVITLLVFTVMLFWDDMDRNEYKGMEYDKKGC
ncbi:hypothetical protein BD560DRAFT_493105 [Blakeslea trispora]|nr:hypothetical protein BD560DRAFT_493105 [Blakeslea trispora]